MIHIGIDYIREHALPTVHLKRTKNGGVTKDEDIPVATGVLAVENPGALTFEGITGYLAPKEPTQQ